MWFLRKRDPKEDPEVKIPFERRKFERIRNILTVLCLRENGHDHFKVLTENVSEGGFQGITQEELVTNEVLQMNILLHSIHTSVQVRGRVAWIRPLGTQQFEVGVEFVGIEMADRLRLKQYIERYRVCTTKGGP